MAGNGLLGGLNMGCTRNVNGEDGCSENHLVNRYEAAQAARIAELETEVKLRDANTYTDQKSLEMYKTEKGFPLYVTINNTQMYDSGLVVNASVRVAYSQFKQEKATAM